MFIRGIGHTKFGISNKTTVEMGYEAAIKALEDAKLKIKDIDAIVISNVTVTQNNETQRHTTGLYSELFDVNIPIIRTPAACAGGGVALFTANKLPYENILVIGSEKLKGVSTPQMTDELGMAGNRFGEQDEGLNFPAQNALFASSYMKKYNVTNKDLSLVAKKNYDFASKNPYAYFFNKTIELKDIENSFFIATPLRLHHCSTSIDGAAAIVLSKKKGDVEIIASSLATDKLSFYDRETFTSLKASKIASQEAYKKAKIKPKDINVAEIHDAFSSLELVAYEDLGFCKKGEGKKLIRENYTGFNGKLPVNTSGGLKAKGHPISATGLSQVVWLTMQLRGTAGDFQIKNPKYALAQNVGGLGSTVTVHILKKVKNKAKNKNKK